MVGMWHLIILVLEGMFGKIHALGAGQNDAVVTHVWWSDWSEMNAGWSTEGGPQFTHDWSQAPRLTTVEHLQRCHQMAMWAADLLQPILE